MPKRARSAKRKRRTRSHVLKSESTLHVQLVLIEAGFIADPPSPEDYGYDLAVFTFDREGKLENGVAFIQVKSTDSPKYDPTGRFILFDVDMRDIDLWIREINPIFLVLYDAKSRKAFWLNGRLEFEGTHRIPEMRKKTIRVRIPIVQVVNASFADFLRRYKSDIVNQTNERVDYGRYRYLDANDDSGTDVRQTHPPVD